MRRLAALFLALSLCACKPHRDLSAYTDESGAPLLTAIAMSNAKALPQITSGFHELEQNSWRWTKGEFSVKLRPPFASSINGAKLVLKANLPDQSPLPVNLTITTGDTALPPVTIASHGYATISLDVPARSLGDDTVTVSGRLDKFLAPGALPGDNRELGIILSYIGLEKK